jgi:hypothetical protein
MTARKSTPKKKVSKFVTTALSSINKSEADIITEKTLEFIEDAKIRIQGEIAQIETVDIPTKKRELAKSQMN